MSDDDFSDDRGDPDDHDADEPIYADSVDDPQGARATLDQLAERAVGTVLELLRRANRFAAGVLMLAGGACVVGFLLGLAALDDGARNAWIVIGGFLAAWAIGSVLVAMWRLSVIRRHSAALVAEVRALIGGDSDSERVVVETVDVTEESTGVSVVQVSRQYSTLRDRMGDRATRYPELAIALASITRFPAMMALAVVIGFGFVAISFIFLLILIF